MTPLLRSLSSIWECVSCKLGLRHWNPVMRMCWKAWKSVAERADRAVKNFGLASECPAGPGTSLDKIKQTFNENNITNEIENHATFEERCCGSHGFGTTARLFLKSDVMWCWFRFCWILIFWSEDSGIDVEFLAEIPKKHQKKKKQQTFCIF